MSDCHIDFETYSAVDLRKTGAYIYAMHPTTNVWCMAYAFDDEPVELWTPGQKFPKRVIKHIEAGGRLFAHNAAFERAVMTYLMAPRYDIPDPELDQWHCTMAMAFAMALPGTLEGAAAAAGLDMRKDMSGRRLMLQMAKPRKLAKHCPACHGTGLYQNDVCFCVMWWDDDGRKERLFAYCRQDVDVERALHKRLRALRPQERRVWLLDQEINDRGVYIDKKLCEQSQKVIAKTQKLLNAEMVEITAREVGGCNNVSELVAWLRNCGLDVDSVNKENLDEMLGGWELPDQVRRALEIRKEFAKTSTAKIGKMLTMRARDGRMRGNLQYHGATTGRWAARGAQLQNLPRPRIKDVPGAINAILNTASPLLLDMAYGPPLSVVSDCIRGIIRAPADYTLMAADFSAIEARVVAWQAQQSDIVQAFSEGVDIYCKQASSIYRRTVTKEDESERQVGKVAILSLGFEGGANAFAKMAGNYGVQLEPLYAPMWELVDEENREKALSGYDQRGQTSKLSKKAWLAAECIKLTWREANPRIVQYWRDLRKASMEAVRNPGQAFPVSGTTYKVAGSFLWCRLPSGRALCYPYPRIERKMMPWGEERPTVVYKTVDSFTKKWGEKVFYGGLACENITQAIARDIMAEAMLRVDKAGYKPIITIHDEVVCEVESDFGDLQEFEMLMTATPRWAKGCPISASAWAGKRYKK